MRTPELSVNSLSELGHAGVVFAPKAQLPKKRIWLLYLIDGKTLKVHDLLIILLTFNYLTFLSDYLSCSLLIIYNTYLTLTYALIGSSCTVIQYK